MKRGMISAVFWLLYPFLLLYLFVIFMREYRRAEEWARSPCVTLSSQGSNSWRPESSSNGDAGESPNPPALEPTR